MDCARRRVHLHRRLVYFVKLGTTVDRAMRDVRNMIDSCISSKAVAFIVAFCVPVLLYRRKRASSIQQWGTVDGTGRDGGAVTDTTLFLVS